jgi:3-oxoacyl-(acyl-carrier-protein) synthase
MRSYAQQASGEACAGSRACSTFAVRTKTVKDRKSFQRVRELQKKTRTVINLQEVNSFKLASAAAIIKHHHTTKSARRSVVSTRAARARAAERAKRLAGLGDQRLFSQDPKSRLCLCCWCNGRLRAACYRLVTEQ